MLEDRILGSWHRQTVGAGLIKGVTTALYESLLTETFCPYVSLVPLIVALNWCRQRLRWTLLQWHQVLLTDESHFCLFHADGRTRV